MIEQLGVGGMAIVYRAVVDGPLRFRRELVIKRMLREYADDPYFVAMMAAEARLGARLHHPGIAQVSEFGQIGGEYYIAMELVDGSDLNSVLRRCRRIELEPSIEACCFVIHELAQALAYAHALMDEQGRPLEIVHRDVSPSNVMLTPAGVVKLVDFGIAKAANEVRDERTRTGAIKGKVGYMSPEQARNEKLDGRSDQFALGTVFYELLTVRRLFKGSSEADTLHRVCAQPIAPPSQLRPAVPPELDAIVQKMLARDPAERYASCADVAAALAPLMERMSAGRSSLVRFLEQLGPLAPSAARLLIEPLGAETEAPAAAPDQPGSSGVWPSSEVHAFTAPASADMLLTGSSLVPSRRGKALWMGLAAGALALAGALVGGGLRLRVPAGPAPRSARVAVTSPAQAPPVALEARADVVTLRVEGTPGAEVRIDDGVVGRTPLVLTLPRSREPRLVTVRRSGFATLRQRVAGDADVTLRALLMRKAKDAAESAHGFNPEVMIRDPFAR